MITIQCNGYGEIFEQLFINREDKTTFHKNVLYATINSGQSYGTVHDFFSMLDHGMINKKNLLQNGTRNG